MQDLIDTAIAAGPSCVGLASNQIWNKDTAPLRVFILLMPDGQWKAFVNPEIIKLSGTSFKSLEGCLSLPNKKLSKPKRFSNITFTYFDAIGKQYTEKWYKSARLPVVAFQHEYDHLNGILI